MIETIAFDADDTLWHNEVHYAFTEERLADLLAPYCPVDQVNQKLYQTETGNLSLFGYGAKSFMLSMIETAIQLSDGRIQGSDIQKIIDAGKEMLHNEIELLPHVQATLETLRPSYRLMLITKGDMLDQESKIRRSGIAHYFHQIEIVSDKSSQTYRHLLHKHDILPRHFLMAGNSLKSDVLPVAALGATAVHVPFHITWAHEANVSQEDSSHDYYTIEHLGQLPFLLQQLQEDN